MSVHADHWIRRMALERGMIEPFEEKLVRRSGEAAIISYGLSSYGYDLRVADEFKVFTNVFNAVVDPKAFDDRSFVDIRGESCLVPPNSFALARSMERHPLRA
jgi:dCTP deaminase